MGLREVYDVDVVTEAGSVLGRIVIAEDAQAFAFSNRGLSDERHEIVRHTARKLADKGRRMGSDRVEVAKGDTLDSRAGRYSVAKDVLAHLLGVAVWRCCRKSRSLLCHRKILSFSVNCSRRREEHIASAMVLRHLEYVEERDKIVAVILDRLCNGFSHSLECGKMDDCIYLVLIKESVNRSIILFRSCLNQ